MQGNSPYEAQELLRQLNAASQLINARNEQVAHRAEASTRALSQSAQHLTGSSERLTQDILGTLRTQGAQALSQGAEQAIENLRQQMQQSIHQARQLEQVLAQHGRGVMGITRTALIVLAVGALLAMGASIYVAHDRLKAIEGAKFSETILQATSSGAINQCGDSLCVRIGKTPMRYKDNPNYVLVDGK
jgi:ElaB/YqjD/DUF883 family membrane-anchored ribosome-binding protein